MPPFFHNVNTHLQPHSQTVKSSHLAIDGQVYSWKECILKADQVGYLSNELLVVIDACEKYQSRNKCSVSVIHQMRITIDVQCKEKDNHVNPPFKRRYTITDTNPSVTMNNVSTTLLIHLPWEKTTTGLTVARSNLGGGSLSAWQRYYHSCVCGAGRGVCSKAASSGLKHFSIISGFRMIHQTQIASQLWSRGQKLTMMNDLRIINKLCMDKHELSDGAMILY